MAYRRSLKDTTGLVELVSNATQDDVIVMDGITPGPVPVAIEDYPLYPEDNRVLVFDIARPDERSQCQVPVNPLTMVTCRCSLCAEINGCGHQANCAMHYQNKYITKNDSEITHTLSLFKIARDNMNQYPSRADDSGNVLFLILLERKKMLRI